MKAFEDLFRLAEQLQAAAATANTEDIEQPLKALQDAAYQVGQALFWIVARLSFVRLL
jgi:hypothetical protein